MDLFWFLFAQTCGFRHTGIDRNCQDLRFPQENGTDCPFVLGERKDLLRLHGNYLCELIMQEGGYTEKFRKQFDALPSDLGQGSVSVSIKSGSKHFQVVQLNDLDSPQPVMTVRCSAGWTLEKRESDHYVKVLRERHDHRVKTCPVTDVKVRYVPAPDQLPNECPARALNEAMELALEWSHGREGLSRDAICSQSKNSCKSKVARQTNAQSDNTRTFMFLSVFKAAAATLGLDFFETLGQVKQCLLKRTKPIMTVAPAPVPDLSQGNQRLLQQPSGGASAAVGCASAEVVTLKRSLESPASSPCRKKVGPPRPVEPLASSSGAAGTVEQHLSSQVRAQTSLSLFRVSFSAKARGLTCIGCLSRDSLQIE